MTGNNSVSLTHDEINDILVDEIAKRRPDIARDRHGYVKFEIYPDGLSAEVCFVSFN